MTCYLASRTKVELWGACYYNYICILIACVSEFLRMIFWLNFSGMWPLKSVDRFVPSLPGPPVSFLVKVKGAGLGYKIKDNYSLLSLLVIVSFHSISKFVSIHSRIHQASLIAKLVKDPRTMQETPVWFLGWEDLLAKRKATHSSILAWRILWTV